MQSSHCSHFAHFCVGIRLPLDIFCSYMQAEIGVCGLHLFDVCFTIVRTTVKTMARFTLPFFALLSLTVLPVSRKFAFDDAAALPLNAHTASTIETNRKMKMKNKLEALHLGNGNNIDGTNGKNWLTLKVNK